MRKLLLALFCLILPLAAGAAPTNIDPRAAKLDVCGAFEIWHVNGVMTSINSATQSLEKIKLNYGNA